MVATRPGAGAAPSWVIPGQVLLSSDPGQPGEYVVARIMRDDTGLCHAVLKNADGREISAFVDQIAYSIAEGMLTPVDPLASRIGAN